MTLVAKAKSGVNAVQNPFAAAWLVIAALLLLSGCEKSPQVHQWSGQTMGTHYTITAIEPAEQGFTLDIAQQRIESELQRVIDAMSTYQSASEIARFSALAAPGCMAISSAFADVVAMALDINHRSNGAFNPLVAPLVNRWGFGSDSAVFEFPIHDEIQTLLKQVNMDALQLTVDSGQPKSYRLCKSAPVQLDLSAIAKGYAVDLLASALNALQVQHYLVDIGGEVKVRGRNPNGLAWRLAIEKPGAGFATVQQVVNLTSNTSIATSGDYRNFFEHQGVRYSHTIDPRTGYPVQHSLASVTVIAESAALADAWATALTVVGPETAKQLAQELNLAVYLVERAAESADGSAFINWHSAAFDGYMPR